MNIDFTGNNVFLSGMSLIQLRDTDLSLCHQELEDAKRLGAEEEQEKFANMSWLERIQKKS